MRSRDNASRWLAAAGGLVTALMTCRPAFAAGRIGLNGQIIQTSQYSIDLHQGAVVSGNRVMGLGGAYVALAEDVDGDLQNPAAPALRPFYSVEYFDYWLGLGLTFPGRLSNSDFFNSGSVTKFEGSTDDAVFVTPALNLQWGAFGLGLTAELQSYSLRNPALPDSAQSASLEALLATYHLQFAYSFLNGQLATGVGIRYLTLEFDAATDDDSTRTLFDTSGAGIEMGVVWRPNLRPYRLGLAFRTEINTEAAFSKSLLPSAEGDIVLIGAEKTLYLPERVSSPWDLNLGAAVQFGKRPLNPVSRTIPQVAERAALTFRLRQLERDDERERRLAEAASASEREVIERELAAEEARDSAQLARDFKQARRSLAREDAQGTSHTKGSSVSQSRSSQLPGTRLLLPSTLMTAQSSSPSVSLGSLGDQLANAPPTGCPPSSTNVPCQYWKPSAISSVPRQLQSPSLPESLPPMCVRISSSSGAGTSAAAMLSTNKAFSSLVSIQAKRRPSSSHRARASARSTLSEQNM